MEKEILALKAEKNAVIMAHNYQPAEIQALADVVGASLELAGKAKEPEADRIVVGGVRFMAETAKILNPGRKVIIPVEDAGCPLADFLTPDLIREARERYPDAAVVVYVNSTAESKALADITCTSANAVNVVASLPNDTILFGPDANLAAYVQRQLPKKTIIPVPPGGHCYVHTGFTLADVEAARRLGGMIVCHPECPPEVQEQADLIASTGGMVRGAAAGGDEPWSIFTERDMVSRLRVLYPGRVFYEKPEAVCADMKKISLADLRRALEREEHEVVLPREVMDRARRVVSAYDPDRRPMQGDVCSFTQKCYSNRSGISSSRCIPRRGGRGCSAHDPGCPALLRHQSARGMGSVPQRTLRDCQSAYRGAGNPDNNAIPQG